jgi:hypothetical protein
LFYQRVASVYINSGVRVGQAILLICHGHVLLSLVGSPRRLSPFKQSERLDAPSGSAS